MLIALLASLALAAPCPPTVAELPDSPLYERGDARLQGTAIVVLKEARRIMVYRGSALLPDACWSMALASTYVPGHKQRQGDMRTPEGWYRTSDRPWSSFYSAITVHYPRAADAKRGLEQGLITQAQHDAIVAADEAGRAPPMETRLGGQIVIHGGGGKRDWTLGCVGMEDAEIDGMRALLPAGMRADLLVLP